MLKILFITHEVTPFSCHTMTGDIAGSLTRALKKIGHEVRVVTPRYRSIRERKYGLRDVARLREMNIIFGGNSYPACVKSGFVPHSKVQVYFVENDDLFADVPSEECTTEESLLRAVFLSHASLQLIAHLNWIPDVIYCCGWKTAATPYLLKRNPTYHATEPHVTTILHCCTNSGDQTLKLDDFTKFDLEIPATGTGFGSLIQLGLQTADHVIQGDQRDMGFAGALMRSLCQADPALDPSTDASLSLNYGTADLPAGKAANKAFLQAKYGLEASEDALLVALWRKEGDGDPTPIISQLASAFPAGTLQFLAVGTGDSKATILTENTFNGQVASVKGLESGDARLIEAGSDVALRTGADDNLTFQSLPSLLYGTLPLIAKVRSEAHPVEEVELLSDRRIGYSYDPSDPSSLLEAIRRVTETYRDKAAWNELARLGMDKGHYWEQAARCITVNLQKPSAPELDA